MMQNDHFWSPYVIFLNKFYFTFIELIEISLIYKYMFESFLRYYKKPR